MQKKRKENTSWSQATFVYFRATPPRHLMPTLFTCCCRPPPPPCSSTVRRLIASCRLPPPPQRNNIAADIVSVSSSSPSSLLSLVAPSTDRSCRHQLPLLTNHSGPCAFCPPPALLLVVARPLPPPIRAVIRHAADAGANNVAPPSPSSLLPANDASAVLLPSASCPPK